jgi:hypothetical protein
MRGIIRGKTGVWRLRGVRRNNEKGRVPYVAKKKDVQEQRFGETRL